MTPEMRSVRRKMAPFRNTLCFSSQKGIGIATKILALILVKGGVVPVLN
jgi:hypothetical protein